MRKISVKPRFYMTIKSDASTFLTNNPLTFILQKVITYSVVSLKCHEVVFALYNLSNMSQLAVDAHLRTSH